MARAAVAWRLDGWPRADDRILIASEFATNAVVHSLSRHGGVFILRRSAGRDRLRTEVEDAGGPWLHGPNDDGRPHGFDVVAALAGAGELGHRRGRRRTRRLGLLRFGTGNRRHTLSATDADV